MRKKGHLLRSTLPCLLLSLALNANAQSANASVNAGGNVNHASVDENALSPQDADWRALDNLRLQGSKNGLDTLDSLVAAADQFRSFYGKYPKDARSDDAKCLEGILLLRAQLIGDGAHSARRQAVIAQSLHNKSVTPTVRAELFAFVDTVAIETGPVLSRSDRLRAYEKATRNLLAEFPDLSVGYESLYAIGHDGDDLHAQEIAKELLALGAAPAGVKAKAQLLLDRGTLVGQPVASLAANLAPANSPLVSPTARDPRL